MIRRYGTMWPSIQVAVRCPLSLFFYTPERVLLSRTRYIHAFAISTQGWFFSLIYHHIYNYQTYIFFWEEKKNREEVPMRIMGSPIIGFPETSSNIMALWYQTVGACPTIMMPRGVSLSDICPTICAFRIFAVINFFQFYVQSVFLFA